MNHVRAMTIIVCVFFAVIFCGGLVVREVADLQAGRTHTCWKRSDLPLSDMKYSCTAEEWRHQQESEKR